MVKFNMAPTARRIVEQVLDVKEGELVLLVTDSGARLGRRGRETLRHAHAASYERGNRPAAARGRGDGGF